MQVVTLSLTSKPFLPNLFYLTQQNVSVTHYLSYVLHHTYFEVPISFTNSIPKPFLLKLFYITQQNVSKTHNINRIVTHF